MVATVTLDSLFDNLGDDQPASTPATPASISGKVAPGRHSIAIGGAKMAPRDPALKGSMHIEALFGGGALDPPPTVKRFHSLPTLLYSETDDPETADPSPKSDSGATEVKRKSLLEMIDADHPASPSKDTDGDVAAPPTPGTPKRRRSLGLSTSPISRPSLIEKETAALAFAAALGCEEEPRADDGSYDGSYGSDTETVAGAELLEGARMPAAQPSASYAPRASLVALTQRNFEAQLRDDHAAALVRQAQAHAHAQAQAQAQQAAAAAAAQQQWQQQQQQQQWQQQQQQAAQFFAAQHQHAQQPQQPPLPYGFPFVPPQGQPMGGFMMGPPVAPPMAPYHFAPVYPPPTAGAPAASPSVSPPPPPTARSITHLHQQQQQGSPARSHHAPSPPRNGGAPLAFKPGQSGNLLELATDKKGSRSLQDGLPKLSDSQLLRACDELRPHLLQLAMHPSGNYIVSRLASLPLAHPYLIRGLTGHVTELIVHPQGSRVVQAAFAELPLAAANELVSELRCHVRGCALDTHGSWGVCAAYKRTGATFILEQVTAHLEALATQQHGCRVVQRVLADAATNGAGVGGPAAALLRCNLGQLAMDPYGNYAVQVTMRAAAPVERARLVGELLPQLLRLSSSKHGSNVAETLLTLMSEAQLQQARGFIFGDRATLRELMGHPFGNYVVQAMLRLLSPDERAVALRAIEVNAGDTTFGRTIVTHLAREDGATRA